MLHTKFQGHRSTGSGVEGFLKVFSIYVEVAILVMWPGRFEQIFVPSVPGGSK